MNQGSRKLAAGALSGLWRALDWIRRGAANLLFLAAVVALAWVLLAGGPKVPDGAALVVRPVGQVVEQLTGASPQGTLTALVTGGGPDETLLKDLLDGIRLAKDDRRIKAIYLDLGRMEGSGMTKLEDLRAAISDFRKSGKKVVAYSDGYTQGPYAVAAAADEVWVNPFALGGVVVEGLGRWRNYYKEALDRLGVEVHVFRVGEYKSAVEPYLRTGPSPEAREADLKWLGDLWNGWVNAVAESRKLTPAEVRAYVDGMAERMERAQGDMARVALEARLVDKLGTRDQVRARMIELVGEDKKEKTFQQVSLSDYLEAKGGDRAGKKGGDAVAVVVAKGDILDGKQPAGTIGGDSTAALIRKARQDEKVKAIVLRVDSPGGSAFASEVIRRELWLAREAGKKVVVSMGSLAASGGYWISTASDEIWASPSTITGSIGIFGMFPTVDKPLAKYLGIRVDGVGTTRLSGAFRPGRPFEPELGRIAQAGINRGYEEFLARVAEARKLTRDEVDRIARGRVWSGADARERKLVDKLGGLPEAIASAAELAKLGKDHRTWWVEEELPWKQRLVRGLMGGQARLARAFGLGAAEPEPPLLPPVARALGQELAGTLRLLSLRDPAGVYAFCPCDAR
ncbi:MAG: signal peptide peptidase SppA [Deltaproteobacteria bacterium]|nr:signal peptide peptidase SppA [Deltaproteobacteria bacterium]